MPTTNEKLVKKITESLDGLSVSLVAAAEMAATATAESALQLKTVLENLSVGGGVPISTPPQGCFKVTNIYVSADYKLKIEYDDTPTA